MRPILLSSVAALALVSLSGLVHAQAVQSPQVLKDGAGIPPTPPKVETPADTDAFDPSRPHKKVRDVQVQPIAKPEATVPGGPGAPTAPPPASPPARKAETPPPAPAPKVEAPPPKAAPAPRPVKERPATPRSREKSSEAKAPTYLDPPPGEQAHDRRPDRSDRPVQARDPRDTGRPEDRLPQQLDPRDANRPDDSRPGVDPRYGYQQGPRYDGDPRAPDGRGSGYAGDRFRPEGAPPYGRDERFDPRGAQAPYQGSPRVPGRADLPDDDTIRRSLPRDEREERFERPH
jgi:outer membrane biosynthesis protein TonB